MAEAGKGYHHTDGWDDDDDGPSYVQQIQAAAQQAAAAFAASVAEREAMRAAQRLHLLLLNSLEMALGLIEGGQELLATAIQNDDPKSELLFRVSEDLARARHAANAINAELEAMDAAKGAAHD